MARMKLAMEHVRRMRGGAQAQLMRCDDGGYYIVKFQNNPQHLRILANEMLASRLAARLGICVPQVEVIDVRQEIIAYTADMVIQLGIGSKPCVPGKQFGSQFPGHPSRLTIHDFLPDEQLREVGNLADFLGIFVFDKWTCNTNGRQAVFFHEPQDSVGTPSYVGAASSLSRSRIPDPVAGSITAPVAGSFTAPVASSSAASSGPGPVLAGDAVPYVAMMIDHGFCFNAGEWDFPDAPLRGIYPRHRVYQSVTGMDAFQPWLDRLDKKMTEDALGEEAGHIPPEWYGDDWTALEHLIERLYVRRKRLPELILSARNSGREPFPNWKVRHA
jgi:hypothetical protein